MAQTCHTRNSATHDAKHTTYYQVLTPKNNHLTIQGKRWKAVNSCLHSAYFNKHLLWHRWDWDMYIREISIEIHPKMIIKVWLCPITNSHHKQWDTHPIESPARDIFPVNIHNLLAKPIEHNLLHYSVWLESSSFELPSSEVQNMKLK